MTDQEAFDGGLAHMRKQRVPSRRKGRNGSCAYRAPSGLKCIVGGIMPNSQYRRVFDRLYREVCAAKLPESVLPNVDRGLLERMQEVHDAIQGEWGAAEEAKMAGIAADFGLTYTPPNPA